MNSRWQAHKAGLVDFWYYDIQEFYFSEGRMLLRGSNGSGKSVTMQSFIPLILDGNMRPERLDPFGSRARRMENYLLEENDKREERTGYLYMEFKRQETDTYLTIGIGMRARKNKKLESWYFILTDGRRVNEDFFLYKDVGSRLVLTKRELKNRLGDGGFVYDSQNEYMEAVNRHVFGFETADEYKEMIDLLIQLRTPKLSKDFKPSVINEILSNSLQTLSEEDLRPMSEAIENMDGLKTNVDTLKESLEAAGRINRIYERYNKAVLLEKTDRFRKRVEEYRELERQTAQTAADMEKLSQRLDELWGDLIEHKNEQQRLQEEQDSLNASDAAALMKRKLELLEKQREDEKSLQRKTEQLEEKEADWRRISGKQKEEDENREQLLEQMKELLEDMENETEQLSFDEFAFMKKELLEAPGERYGFGAHKQLLEQRLALVAEAVKSLQEQEVRQLDYDEKLRQLEAGKLERDKKEREARQYESQLNQVRSEAVESLYGWEHSNRELRLSGEELQQIARRLEQFGAAEEFGDIRETVRAARYRIEEGLQNEKRSYQKEEADRLELLKQKQQELDYWTKQEEAEPECSEAVKKNRQLLKKLGIPYYQFYKTIDFEAGITKEQQNRIEEALLHMGILDALIVPEEYREQILQLDSGLCDRYMFSSVDRVRENMEQVLTVHNAENDILFYQQISGALDSIGYEGNHHTAVYQDGSYQIGAVTGTITGEYCARFIGVKAREAYRQQQIERLTEETEQLRADYEEATERVRKQEERIRELEKEFAAFPGGEDLRTAWKEYEQAVREVEHASREAALLEEKAGQAAEVLNEVKKRSHAVCTRAYLPMSLSACEAIQQGFQEYRRLLGELEIWHNKYRDALLRIEDLKERLERLDEDMDGIRYEKGLLERELVKERELLQSVLEQLKLKNYDEIQERLEYCTRRLRELPAEIEELLREEAQGEANLKNLERHWQEQKVRLAEAENAREAAGEALSQEYKLAYVEMPEQKAESVEERENLESLAQKLHRLLEQQTERKTPAELSGDLQGIFHENRAQLSEYQLTMEHLF